MGAEGAERSSRGPEEEPLGDTLESLRARVADLTAALGAAEERVAQDAWLLREAQRVAHGGSWTWNLETNDLCWSDEYRRVLGVPDDAAPSVDIYLRLVHPEDHSRVRAMVERLRASGHGEAYEHRIVRPADGALRYLFGRCEGVRNLEGQRMQIGFVIDTTDRRLLDEQIVQNHKLEALGRFAGELAHGFNDTLTAILAHADLARIAVPPSSPAGERLDKVCQTAARASRLVAHLLAFARPRPVEVGEVDPRSLVAAALRLTQPMLPADVVVQSHVADDAGLVRGESPVLERMLTNLLLNARDAMPAGGRLWIDVDRYTHVPGVTPRFGDLDAGRYVRLTVTDSGSGMNDYVRLHALEPFFSTKEHGRGSGLGLSVCHRIVRQHGGAMAIESEPGRGTVVEVVLPRADARVRESREAPPPPAYLGGSLSPEVFDGLHGAGRTVLLIEDDPDVREVSVLSLRALGYGVLAARTGREGIETAVRETGSIDLALVDLGLPDLDGVLVAESLRRVRPGLAILFASGHGPHGPRRVALPAGASFLAKPFGISRLGEALRGALAAAGVPASAPEGAPEGALAVRPPTADDHAERSGLA